MSVIESNIFDINNKKKKEKNSRLVNSEINPNIIVEDINTNFHKNNYCDKGLECMNQFEEVLHNCKGYENIIFNEIELDFENFKEYHYALMSNNFVVVTKGEDYEYRYQTPNGTIFKTHDLKLLKLINNAPYPYKISLNYVPSFSDERIIGLDLLSLAIFNIKEDDPVALLKHYLKPSIKIDSSSIYSLNQYLFKIYSRLEYIITSNHLWKYINLEQSIYNISKSIKNTVTNNIDYDKLNEYKNSFITELTELYNKHNIQLEPTSTKEELLQYVKENKICVAALNEFALKTFNDDFMIRIVKLIDNIKIIDNIINTGYINEINPINKIGNINKGLDLSFNPTSKIIIKGNYTDINFKIISTLLHNEEYINICTDHNLLNILLGQSLNKNIEYFAYHIELYLLAITEGYKTKDEIKEYFKANYILLNNKDIDNLITLCNNALNSLLKQIEEFNNEKYIYDTSILLRNANIDKLGVALFAKKRLIIKNLINDIYSYCKDFNIKNKAKIELLHFDDNSVYLIVDEEAFNVAFETLTRLLPNTFTEYCKRVCPRCIIETIEE